MNARSVAGMEQHPDIMELRARYELAATTPLAQFADGLVFLTNVGRRAVPALTRRRASGGPRGAARHDVITRLRGRVPSMPLSPAG